MGGRFVLGVDGGNTKTHYALFDGEGNPVSFIHAGTASHERMNDGYEGMEREMELRITQLLEAGGHTLEDVGFAVFGLAGADTGRQYAEIGKRIDRIGIKSYKVFNDAFLGIKAGIENGYGISSNSGTGTSCVGVDGNGKWLQIGGCGELTGDDAGGGYFEKAAVRAVYESVFKCGRQTAMKEMLFEVLQITDEDLFLETVYEKLLTRKIKQHVVSKIPFLAANNGDEVALDLLRHVGKNLADSVIGVYKRLDFIEEKEINVVMAGSVYVKSECPVMVETFKSEVTNRMGCNVNFSLLKEPPVAGAVIWALEELNGCLGSGLRKKVINSVAQQNK